MNIDKLRSLVNYDSETPRVAELAALFVQRSFTITEAPGLRNGAFVERGKISTDFRLSPALAARIAAKLVAYAETLHALAELECNYGLTPSQERKQDEIAAKAVESGEALGFRVGTYGDPRGCVVKLYNPQNERDGDGFGGGWGCL